MKSSSENCDGNRKKSDLPPSDSRRLDAIRGCLIGGAVGDALGVADGDVVVVCGTFTILKEAYEWIEKRQ